MKNAIYAIVVVSLTACGRLPEVSMPSKTTAKASNCEAYTSQFEGDWVYNKTMTTEQHQVWDTVNCRFNNAYCGVSYTIKPLASTDFSNSQNVEITVARIGPMNTGCVEVGVHNCTLSVTTSKIPNSLGINCIAPQPSIGYWRDN